MSGLCITASGGGGRLLAEGGGGNKVGEVVCLPLLLSSRPALAVADDVADEALTWATSRRPAGRRPRIAGAEMVSAVLFRALHWPTLLSKHSLSAAQLRSRAARTGLRVWAP